MKHQSWTNFVDLVTVFWLAAFTCGLLVSNEDTANLCKLITFLLFPIFVTDLYFLFKRENDFRTFVKKRWFDILLVVPYFRIFRILKFARLLRALKVIKFAKILGFTRAGKKGQRVAKSAGRPDNKSLNSDVSDADAD